VKIASSKLTTCGVAADWETVELEFLDQSGAATTLQLPLDQAEAVVMTLPHVLAYALKRRIPDSRTRAMSSAWANGASRIPGTRTA
jgi:hypothetical protein